MNINCSDGLAHIKTLDDFSQDLIFSDIPYALGTKWTINENGDYLPLGKSVDFMNKWPMQNYKWWNEYFGEAFRVCKHGSYMIVYSIDRQQDFFTYYARKNGFEVMQSMYYYYISSFPKALDVSTNIDKRFGQDRIIIGKDPDVKRRNKTTSKFSNLYGNIIDEESCPITAPSSELAIRYNNFKYSIAPLKQCLESILVFRKPLLNKGIVDDIFQYEKDMEEKGYSNISPAIVNIDAGRVLTTDEKIGKRTKSGFISKGSYYSNSEKYLVENKDYDMNGGRYPSQLFISDGYNISVPNLVAISKQATLSKEDSIILDFLSLSFSGLTEMTEDEISKYVNDWNNQFSASNVIDNQSGELTSGTLLKEDINVDSVKMGLNTYGKMNSSKTKDHHSNSGGASRICHQIRYEEQEILDLLIYNKKVARAERQYGCDKLPDKEKYTAGNYSQSPTCVDCHKTINGTNDHSKCSGKIYYKEMESKTLKNDHPTLKSISLNTEILKLFKHPDDIQKLYIPFSGVFSEVIGAMFAGFNLDNITTCEKESDYIEIGEARLDAWKKLYENGFSFDTKVKEKEIKKEITKKPKKPKKIKDDSPISIF